MIKGKKLVKIILMTLIFLPILFSCSGNKEQKSFTKAIDEIDALINQKQYKEAIKALEQAEKIAFSSWSVIGIYRRYVSMGENEHAENTLAKAIKRNPDNLELYAVYTYFLVGKKRYTEALAVGKCLQGTKYGSIYSQAKIEDTILRAEGDKRIAFINYDYYPIYFDAYTASKENAWLRNCALIHLNEGAFENAAKTRPAELSECDDAYFWALVMYATKRFGEAINYIDIAKRFAALPRKPASTKKYLPKLLPLEADSYTSLKDEENAEKTRQKFIKSLPSKDGAWVLDKNYKNDETASIFTNSARWALDNNDDRQCEKYLKFCVNEWQDFVPALCLYANFAYVSNLPPQENSIQKIIRDAGVTTLEMEKFDNRAKIPLSDAKLRIKESLERTADPILYIVDLDLRYKTAQNMSEKEKSADLWNILEKNTLAPGIYPDALIDYSLSFLINNRMAQDAWSLFSRTICRKYNISQENFWTEIFEQLPRLSQRELEYTAYFAASFLRADDALNLYQKCVFETGSASTNAISPLSSDYSAINLAMIYNSLDKKTQAIDLYSKIVGRCTNLNLKSLVLYRIALIYYLQGDITNARRNVEYSLTLNQQNADARLLLSRIKTSN